MGLRERIKRWYVGEYVPPENDPSSGVFFVMGHDERHWTSRLTHVAVDFYLKEWRWLLPFLVAVVGAVVGLAKLFSHGPA